MKKLIVFEDLMDGDREFPVIDIKQFNRKGDDLRESPLKELVRSVNAWINHNRMMVTDIVLNEKFYTKLVNFSGFKFCGIRTLAGDALVIVNPDQDLPVMCYGDKTV